MGSSAAQSKTGDFLLQLFKVFCSAVIVVCLYFTVTTLGPWVETRWFPVVSKLRIVSAIQNLDRNTVIMAEFTKLRECEYGGIAWFRGSQKLGFERIPVELMRSKDDNASPNRPTGTQRAGPWIVHLPPEELTSNSFARLTHRCHGLWVSTTDFYP